MQRLDLYAVATSCAKFKGQVFCDGPDHDLPDRKESDQRERGKLADLGSPSATTQALRLNWRLIKVSSDPD